MSTIEITRIDDLREGDYVTLRWEKSEGGTVTLEGPMRFRATVGGYVITDARFVSATREVPEWEPGTAGTAKVRGVEGVRVMRTSGTGGADLVWLSASMVSGVRGHVEGDVTDFVPDDAEALRRSLEVAREGYRKEAAAWRARDTRMGAEVERLEAEVKRLRAARQAPTRKRIVDAMWPDAPESARAGMTHLDIVDRVHALFEQGGAS